MFKPFTARVALLTAIAATLSGCVDDSYDLNDIDTTTEVKVNDLTVPVNIDQVTLDDVIDLDSDSRIKIITLNGKEVYAIVEDGTFDSSPVNVKPVTATAPTLEPTEVVLNRSSQPTQAPAAAPTAADYAATYEVTPTGNDFSFNANNIDPAVEEITSAGVSPMTFTIVITAKDVENSIQRMSFTDIKVQMPKGLTIVQSQTNGSYDYETGIWSLPNTSTSTNVTTFKLVADAVNFKANNAGIVNHTLSLEASFRVLNGYLTLTPKMNGNTPVPLPDGLTFHLDYNLSNLTVKTFSGRIKYNLDNMDIAPIKLDDIPDIISKKGTDIILKNPQIYMQANNPVASDKLTVQTGLTLTAKRYNAPEESFSPNAGETAITIGYDNASNIYNFLLSPSKEGVTPPAEYAADWKWVEFTSLSNILSSPEKAGIPDEIAITLDNPCIPSQPVENFPLGRDFDGVRGSYKLIAPLALAENSIIMCKKRETGWSSETLDAITISKLTVTADVNNQCPADAIVTAYPLDKAGKRIAGVEIQSTGVKANAAGQKLTLTMTGTIRHLDGIEVVGQVESPGSDEAISPTQTITLTNVRATVSGNYTKKL